MPERNDPTTSARTPGPGTTSVWGGEAEPAQGAGTQVPIVRSVAFGYRDVAQWEAVGRGEAPGDIYSRNTNPTVRAFERKIQQLEGAESATSFASGMAA
ncbi:MAG: PLP-dependent transferase, partial [Vicinamibacterales bacterium]|nr:PLP-dependent transferase [Vicinamibacterales bacterium]